MPLDRPPAARVGSLLPRFNRIGLAALYLCGVTAIAVALSRAADGGLGLVDVPFLLLLAGAVAMVRVP